jgi:NAD(P)H-dependent FMN reductase
MNENKMIISIFIGSVRDGRMGDKVANWIAETLEQRIHKIHIIDPLKFPELLILKTPNHYNKEPSTQMQQIHNWLEESDGFVIVTPEYNHSYSGAIKNALDNFMPEYAKKPFGIVSYSISPFGGIRANEDLRHVISELKGVSTPIPLIIPVVQNVFDQYGKLKDNAYTERLNTFLDDFEWYVNALKMARIKK